MTFPRWLAGIALSCCAIHFLPGAHEWLRYDRDAILSGEWWRLLSGHLVHFSTRHLLLNLAAFVVIGCLLKKNGAPPNRLLLILGMLFISFGLLLLRPGMAFYAGFSGIVSLLFWHFALNGLRTILKHRLFFSCLILCLAAKLAFELTFGNSLALSFDNGVVTEPMAHLLGALFAIGWSLRPTNPKNRGSNRTATTHSSDPVFSRPLPEQIASCCEHESVSRYGLHPGHRFSRLRAECFRSRRPAPVA